MRKFAVVRHSEAEITLSMVRWGWVRRFALFWGKKLGKINSLYIAIFTPKYEIAVYEGGTVFFQRPRYIFYYPDAAIASKRWGELASTLEREGFSGMSDFMSDDPREEGFISNMDLLLAERLRALRCVGKSTVD